MESTDWVQVSLDKELNQRNLSRVVARQLIRMHGESAHLIALSEMLKENPDRYARNWRQVLDIIDEINKGETNERS